MATLSKNNSLSDIEGLIVGNYTDMHAASGVTVVICKDGAVAGVDVRGSAPGTRETDLLEPLNLVEKVQAIVLSGGSVYGLSASDGVVRWLAEKGLGFPLDEQHVAPIVPAAVLYDLGRGKDFIPPINPDWGRKACLAAKNGPIVTGCFGAGTGALSDSVKGGLGTAGLILDSGITVTALVAVNSFGSTINPATGRFWEIDLEMEEEFGEQGRRSVELPLPPDASPSKNTTIGIVATDATLTKTQAKKIAQMAHDGMARAIRPSHTLFDGDTIFSLATCKIKLPEIPGFFVAPQAQAVNEIGHAAADCMSRAIIHAILAAKSQFDIKAFCDLKNC